MEYGLLIAGVYVTFFIDMIDVSRDILSKFWFRVLPRTAGIFTIIYSLNEMGIFQKVL